MTGNVRTLQAVAAVAAIDHSEAIASGMEQVAKEIRARSLPYQPVRCAIILGGRGGGADDLGVLFFGGESSTAEVIGMFELGKLQVMQPE